MSTTIESLELEVQSSATSAVDGIDALSASLSKLKIATKGGVGLRSVANQLRDLNTALSGVDGSSIDKVDKLATSLSKLSGLGNLKLSSSIGNQLKNIGSAATSLNSTDFSGISKMATAVSSLSNIGNASGLSSTITQLNKIPSLAQTLNGVDWNTFTSQIQAMSNALAPLANQLNTVSNAFNRLPSNIRSVVSATNSLTQANDKATTSYANLWAKARMAYNAVRTGAKMIASWINESNTYIENLNLFTASMGEYAAEAQEYAETVGEIMGIDPGEWMRNQGVFMTITEGFGVASDRAYTMSKNLTQLGYDLSSFFNISYEDAMQKLTSGISGELEPLRRLGYDLSEARLKAEALSLGIEKSFSEMTQAEKAQLRYYAIMTQVTVAQGDMARTLDAPANQLRILKAQVTQCARALGNIFIPVLNKVLPYAIALANVIRYLANAVASFFGFTLPEVDYSSLTSGANAVADSVEDTEDGLNGATKAAKKLKNAMLGIDELNIISPNDDSSGSGSSGSGSGAGGFDFDLPEYDFLGEAINSKVEEITQMIKDSLWEVEAVISGFALAIGTILVVTGANIPLGLGLMAIGAVGLVSAIAANWNTMSEKLAKVLTIVTGVIGGFLLAIGAFLAFSGVNVGLGAALMVAGAVSLATAATINWKFLNGDLSNALSILTGIVSGALLAMGALFAFTGVAVPLGIALMAAGAIGLVTAVGLNWDCMSAPMKKAIGTLEAIVGGALLTFGAILALTGVNIPLGVGMIAAGAVSLISAVALNWDSLTGDLKGSISTITAIVSGALIGIGAILAFTGVATPLGIAMIAAGAVGIIATASLNWSSITDKIKGVLKEIGVAVGAALIAVGAILACTGVALPLGIALIAAGAVSLVSGIALNWDSITEKIKGVFNKIKSVAGSLGKLAIGLILCLSGVGIPLGIALIASAASDFATGKPVSWDEMVNKVSEGLNNIATKFGEFKTKVSEKLGEAKDAITEWAGNAKEFFTKGADGKNAIDNIKEAASEWGASFKTGFSEKFNDAKSWVEENVTEPISKAIKKSKGFEIAVNVANKASEWWNNAKSWWSDVSKDGVTLETGVELVKEGWTTVKGWIGKIPGVSQSVSLLKSGWSTVKDWVGKIPTVEQGVELAKEKWSTVKEWVGNIPIVEQGVELAKSGWQTVKSWIGNIPTLSQTISLLKSGWTTVKNWVGNIPTLSQAISLLKSGWTTVKNWIGTIPVLSQAISLLKSGWTTVKNWIGTIPVLSQAISLLKSGWTTVKDWIGNIPTLSQAISLLKSGWTKVSDWVSNYMGSAVNKAIGLSKTWTTVAAWVGNYIGGSVSVTVNLLKGWYGKIKDWLGLSSGGIVSASGAFKLFASGGTISSNGRSWWDSVPKYAGGTSNAHGSLFVAGEDGAELVGHVNGTTEVLNRFQLAQVMHSSIVDGMRQFTGYWRGLNSQMAVCANAIIRSILVSSDYLNANLATADGYDPTNTLAQTMYEDSQQAYKNGYSTDSMYNSMRDFYKEYVEPTMKEIAADAKRQADKEEQTIVQIGNRAINDAVVTQQKKNGYVFAK